jgi:hypothetical protein
MGHNTIAGYCSTQVIAGTALLRVDVPVVEGMPAHTKFFGGSAIYALTPVDAETAKIAAAQLRVRPVDPWVVPTKRLPTPTVVDLDKEEEEY